MPLSDWKPGGVQLPDPTLMPLPQDEFNPFTAAIKSYGFSATGGLLGLRSKDPDITQFQKEFPVASTLVDLAGYVTPYVGWYKAAAKIPSMAKLLGRVSKSEKLAEAPFVQGAAREIVTLAPLEATRLGTSAFMGDFLADRFDAYNLGTGHVAQEAALNMAIGGVVGGAFEKLLAGGGGIAAKQRERVAYPGLNAADPPQIQLRQIREKIEQGAKEGTPPNAAEAEQLGAAVNQLRMQILDEQPLQLDYSQATKAKQKAAKRHVRLLESAKTKNASEKVKLEAGRQINRFFRLREGKEKALKVSRVKKDVLGADEYAKVRTHLPKDFEQNVQFPRLVTATSDKTAEAMQKNIIKNMDSVDGAVEAIAREGSDGLFVVTKKITGDKTAKAGDEWLVFKTDQPGKFFPEKAEWQTLMAQRNAWLHDALDANIRGGKELPVWGQTLQMREALRATDYAGMEQGAGTIAKTVNKLMQKMDLDPSNSLAYQRMAKFVNDYMTPTMLQFKNSPLSRVIWAQGKMAYDSGRNMADEIFYGKTVIDGTQPLKLFLGSDFGKGIKFDPKAIDKSIDRLYEDAAGAKRFWLAVRGNYSIDEAIQKLDIGPLEIDLMKALQGADDMTNSVEKAVEALAGLKESRQFDKLDNHYLISNTWRGTMRTPVWGANKTLIGVGAGDDARQSFKAAEEIQNTAGRNGVPTKLGATVEAGELEADRALRARMQQAQRNPEVKQLHRRIQGVLPDPKTYDPRKGVGGFIGEDRPWTKLELKNIAHDHLRARWRRVSNLSYDTLTKRSRAMLIDQDPGAYELLAKRISQLEGHQSTSGKIINKVADEILAPFMGKNSASRIIGAANSGMFQLELGFLNLTYAMANAVTFMQTSLPLASFVTTAVPERVAEYFTFFPIQGAKAAGHVGVLDIMKVTAKSFKDMVKPPPELSKFIQRAASEGVIDPKFVEDVVGQNSRVAQDVGQAMSGTDGFANFIKSWGKIIPGASERMSRGHSFALGYRLGKIYNMEGDQLYHWSKEFTEKSMFLYSSADRPMVITGPFGSGYGLFKNWLMHYMNWGMTFAGEGVKYGNWNPLMTMVAGTTVVGGVPGIVGFGAVDALQKTFTDKSMIENIYGTFGGDKEHIGLGDAVYYGLPGLLGFSLQNTVAMPFADPARDASFIFGLAYWDRMKAFGKMTGDAYDQVLASGRHPGTDPHLHDSFIRAFAPKALVRLASIDYGASDAIHSMTTGNTTIDKLGPAQKMLYTLGVNPKQIELGYAVSNELWKDQRSRLAAIQAMGQEWADATEVKDYQALKEITYRAVTRNIDMSSIIKSAQSRLRRGREDLIESQFSPQAVYPFHKMGLY